MPVPVAQAGAKQVYAFSTLPKLVTLAGAATNGPIIAWRWDMLWVPPGSTANVGVNGDFTNGVATIQNPQFTFDVPGCIPCQLKARNATGWSVPALDREGGQTAVYILTEDLSLRIPGAFMYRYDGDLNETLLEAEGILADHSARHQNGGADEIATATPAANAIPKTGAGSALDAWISDAAAGTKGLIQLTEDLGGSAAAPTVEGLGGDVLPTDSADGFLKRNAANNAWEEVAYGSGSNTVCEGDDARLSDARTPLAHAGSHEGGGDPMTVDAAAGTGSLRTLGTAATSACAGNDGRLSDARAPTAHAGSHVTGGDQLADAVGGGSPVHGLMSTTDKGRLDGMESGADVTGSHAPQAHAASHENPAGGDQISVAGLSGVLADAQNANQIQGRDVVADVPADGDVYKWNDGDGEWQPGAGGGDPVVWIDRLDVDGMAPVMVAGGDIFLVGRNLLGSQDFDSIVLTQGGAQVTLYALKPGVSGLQAQIIAGAGALSIAFNPVGSIWEITLAAGGSSDDDIATAFNADLADSDGYIRAVSASGGNFTLAQGATPLAGGVGDYVNIKVIVEGQEALPANEPGINAGQKWNDSWIWCTTQPSLGAAKDEVDITVQSSGSWSPPLSTTLDGVGGGGSNVMVAMALNESTDSAADVVVGALGLAGSFFPDPAPYFVVTAYVTGVGLTGRVTLYNLTHAVDEASIDFTELISTRKSVHLETFSSLEHMYEIRIKVTGGGSPVDRVLCMWAGVEGLAP